jgi:hypothetical protein
MEAHTIGFGVAAAVCGMFGAIVIVSMERDHRESERVKASDQLKALQSELATAEERKVRATKRLDAAKGEEAKLSVKKLDEKLAATKAELEATEKALEEARSRSAETGRQRADSVERNRAGAVGTTQARLPLTNGKVLLEAKLTKVTDQELSFSHTLGRSTVMWNLLPPELIERFELGPPAEVAAIDDPAPDATPIPAPVADEIPGPEPAEPHPEELATRATRLKQARFQLEKLDNAIRELEAKAAPNRVQIQKLLDQKTNLESRIRQMEGLLFQ